MGKATNNNCLRCFQNYKRGMTEIGSGLVVVFQFSLKLEGHSGATDILLSVKRMHIQCNIKVIGFALQSKILSLFTDSFLSKVLAVKLYALPQTKEIELAS